jgi:hypothetical protein
VNSWLHFLVLFTRVAPQRSKWFSLKQAIIGG